MKFTRVRILERLEIHSQGRLGDAVQGDMSGVVVYRDGLREAAGRCCIADNLGNLMYQLDGLFPEDGVKQPNFLG